MCIQNKRKKYENPSAQQPVKYEKNESSKTKSDDEAAAKREKIRCSGERASGTEEVTERWIRDRETV